MGRAVGEKTSLLQAGVVPRLREAKGRPEFHRLTYGKHDRSPLEQILGVLGAPTVPFKQDEWLFELPGGCGEPPLATRPSPGWRWRSYSSDS